MKPSPKIQTVAYEDYDGSLFLSAPCPYYCGQTHLHTAGKDPEQLASFLGYQQAPCDDADKETRERGYELVGAQMGDGSIGVYGSWSPEQLAEIRQANAKARQMSPHLRLKKLFSSQPK